MRLAILLLIAVIGVVIGLFIYRTLIHSKCFARFIGDVVEPTPEGADDTFDQLKRARDAARNQMDRTRATRDAAIEDEQRLRSALPPE